MKKIQTNSASFPFILVSMVLVILVSSSIPGLSSEYFLPLSFALPEFFVDSDFVGSLDTPTTMEFAPDGRLFVTEKGGDVRVVKNGSLLATPFVSISVNSDSNNGINGITFDPDFANNGFVYVYYTTSDLPIHNRISQFTADPANPDVALAGSEVQIFNLDDTNSVSANHTGGAMHFGNDGKLYVTVGENAIPSNSQDLSTNLGKIIRINSDGTIPTDNPFFNTSGAKQEIWALGFRNPYTSAYSAETGKFYVNDVGEATWEEINSVQGGANYGWPTCEGVCSPTNPSFTDPISTYTNGSDGAAITGGTFYESNQFPASYYGSYFFGDYVNGFIKTLSPTNVVSDFHTTTTPIDIDVGPDGTLYYLSIATGEVRKIQYIPALFENSNFVSGLNTPTTMAFAPDGRLFVTEKGGDVRVVKDGSLLATPFLSVSVTNDNSSGLNGIIFDPDFSTNGFVYVYYTTDDLPAHNRISQFTADPANPDVSLAGSEVQIFNLDNLNSNPVHSGGAMHFGNDGKLYLATGDAGSPSSNAQDLSTNLGKIIRINSDGTIPSDNPFFNTSGAKQEIWALGFRNPFTSAYSAESNKLYINDVGEFTWEEVNSVQGGANYGWPTCEGVCSPTNPAFTDPIYTYNHGSGGAAVTGGVFYESNQFPASYYGSYFFGDYVNGFIKILSPTNLVSDFLTAITPIDIDVGPDGSLYFLEIATGEVRKVQYVINNEFPTASVTAIPLSGQPPLTVNFDGSLSSDPDTGTILSYLWNFGDGASDSTSGDTVSHIYNQLGPYDATLTVNDGEGGVDSANVTIEVGNPPTGTITNPSTGLKYNAGDTINFEGSGIDTQDGSILPDSAFEWTIIFHHNTHIHPFTEFIGITQGSFTIPTLGESASDVWYRIHLKTTNSIGISRTVSTDVTPNTSTITLDSDVPGLQVKLDGQPKTTPISFVGVVGIDRELQAVTPQSFGGNNYQFVSWSDGGAATHFISTPTDDTTYTVNNTLVPFTPISFDNSNSILCSSASCSVPLDVASGDNRVIIVAVADEASPNPVTSVDINGGTAQGVFLGSTQIGSGSTTQNVEMWMFFEADIIDGTNNITVNFGSSVAGAGISVLSYSNVKQQLPEAQASNSILGGTVVTVQVTTITDGSLIVSLVGNGQTTLYSSHGDSQTELENFTTTSAATALTYEIKETAGSDDQSHTLFSTTNRQAVFVIVLAPAVGSPTSDTTAPTSNVSPSGGTYTSAQLVSLTADESATIYYTLNGSTPTTSSTEYTSTISISVTSTLKFFAVDSAGNEEAVNTEEYVFNNSSNDIFGIQKIYPTKNGGNTWFMDMTNPTADPRFDPQGTITQNLDGSWKMTQDQVRMNVFSTDKTTYENTAIPTYSRTQLAANGFMQLPSDWRNFEITGYIKLNDAGGAGFTWYGRGGTHTDSRDCEGSSTKGQLYNNGDTRFAKESWHVNYDFTDPKPSTSPLLDKWTGFKFIVYNQPGVNFVQQVQQEIWVDVDHNNTWVKVDSFVDDGFGSGANHCGPAIADNMPMTWGGPKATFRTDGNNDFDFKYLSVREIQVISTPVYDGTKAGVMLTFEHATSDQIPAIDANMADMVGTMGPLSERVGNSGHITKQELLDLQAKGWEISSHSATHADIDSGTSASILDDEIVQSKIALEAMGFQIDGYIWPGNRVTTDGFDLVKDNYTWTTFYSPISGGPKYMTLSSLDDSFQAEGVYHEFSHGVGNGYDLDSFSDVKFEIDLAITNNYLIGFKLHNIETGSDARSTSPTMFKDIIDYLREQRDLGKLDVLTRNQGFEFLVSDTTAPLTTASPPGSTYTSAQLVTLTVNEPATIYYTTDGSTPDTSSAVYTTPISIPVTTTLQFFAVDTAVITETVNTEVYTINIGAPDTTAPITTATLPGGTYTSAQLVTLTANEPATIYYTINGSTPDTSSTVYTTPISIPVTTTLQFFAVDVAAKTETVNTEVYTINIPVSSEITFDNSNSDLCSSASCPVSLVVASGDNRVIIVTVADEASPNPVTSVDINGGTAQGIFLGSEQAPSGGNTQNVEMWMFLETDIIDGTNTITVNFGSSVTGAGISLMSYSGVKQQLPEAQGSNSVLEGTVVTVEITTLTDGSLIVSVVGNGKTNLYSFHGVDQTELQNFATTSAAYAVTYEIKETAGLDTQSHTTFSTTNRQAVLVIVLAPVLHPLL